jgi:hypothetical protein
VLTVLKCVEHLTHFRCGVCNGWWSIGDAPERDHWFCPWCGAKLETQPSAEAAAKPQAEIGEEYETK